MNLAGVSKGLLKVCGARGGTVYIFRDRYYRPGWGKHTDDIIPHFSVEVFFTFGVKSDGALDGQEGFVMLI